MKITSGFKLVIQFFLIAVFFITMVNSSYALMINQDTANGDLQIQAYEPLGQSFTATDTNIGSVGLFIIPYNQHFNDPTLTMSLFSGAGDFSAGTLLISQDFTLSTNYLGWIDLGVGSVSFNQNAQYTIGIFNDTPQWGVGINWSGNPYNGGTAFFFWGSPG